MLRKLVIFGVCSTSRMHDGWDARLCTLAARLATLASVPARIPAAQKLCTHGPSHRRAKRRIAFRLRQRGHFSARVGSLLPSVAHSCIGVTELISLAPRAQPPSWPQPARLLMCARVWPASTLPGEAARQRGSARRRFRLGAGGARGWEARRTEILPNSLREASGGKQGTFSIGLR